ncbi:hypothetical protein MVEG_03619 [Podila verticillata NRRL 6337]|nr:hypothetical protein MVEG_03619 [Podila verticillata NRRL 6337]
MVHPLALPELVFHIGKHILPSDLPSCVRVSKDWHAALFGFLFRAIDLSPDRISPQCSSGEIQHHIRYLRFLAEFPLEYLNLRGCNQLTTLRLDISQEYSFVHNNGRTHIPPSVLHGLTLHSSTTNSRSSAHTRQVVSTLFPALIQSHTATLTWITLTCGAIPESSMLWDAIESCSRLVGLELFSLGIPAEQAATFWKVCSGVKSLGVYHCSLPENDAQLGKVSFPRLEELSWQQVLDFPDGHLLRLLETMPVLRSFSWQSSDSSNISEMVPNGLCRLAELGQLLCIRSLSFADPTFTDTVLSTLLRSTEQLTCLSVPSTGFGPLAFGTLREQGLLPHMKQLCLTACEAVSSGMIQEILDSCPELEVLEAETLYSSDILGRLDWTCERLRRLAIGIVIDSVSPAQLWRHVVWQSPHRLNLKARVEDQQMVLQRIASLSRLESLVLKLQGEVDGLRTALDLGVDKGLTKLATLTRLREFEVPSFSQHMDVPEIEWMIEHWPRLEIVAGELNVSRIVNLELKEMLERHGVRHQQEIL